MSLVVVDLVDYFCDLVLVCLLVMGSLEVRDYVFVEFVGVFEHVVLDLLLREHDRLLHLVEVLQLLDLIGRKLVFGCLENALISKELLSLLLSYYLFRRLLARFKPQRSRVEGERVKKLFLPVLWV